MGCRSDTDLRSLLDVPSVPGVPVPPALPSPALVPRQTFPPVVPEAAAGAWCADVVLCVMAVPGAGSPSGDLTAQCQ